MSTENGTTDSGIWSAIDSALDWLASVCKLLTGVAMVTLTVIFGWLVFGRYVLNATPTWVEQLSLLLVMLIVFLGASVGIHENTHLSVTLFRDLAPRWLRRAFVAFTDLTLAVFGFGMARYGWDLTVFKWGSEIPLLGLPEGLRSTPLTIGGALIALFAAAHLARTLRGADFRRSATS